MSEMDLKQRVAYLQGLAQGLQMNNQAPEGRVLTEVIGILSDMSTALYDLRDAQTELESYVEDVDEDLSAVEDDLYGDDDEAEPEAVEVTCPRCGTVLHVESVDGDDDSLDLICPNCGEVIYDTDDDLDYTTPDDDEQVGRTSGRPLGNESGQDHPRA